MLKEYTVDSFYGGISEDDALTQQGQILYSYNIDLTSHGDFINVAPSITQLFTTTDDIQYIFEAGKSLYGTKMFYASDDKKIYNYEGDVVWVSSYDILGHWQTSTSLYLIDAVEDIYKISLDDITDADWSPSISLVDSTIPTSGNSYYLIISDEDKAFIGVGNKVYEFSNSTDTVGDVQSFDEDVKGLTYGGGVYLVFLSNGKLALRDGTVDGIQEIKYLGQPITTVKEIANNIYIFSLGGIYVLNGYTMEPLLIDTNSQYLNNPKVNVNVFTPAEVDSNKNILYFKTRNFLQLEGPDETYLSDGISTLGNKKTTFPLALNNFINNDDVDNINCFYVRSYVTTASYTELFICYRDNSNIQKVGKIDLYGRNYNTSKDGLIVLPKFYGYSGEKKMKKNLFKIKVQADMGSDNRNKIYLYKVNEGSRNMSYLTGAETTSVITGYEDEGIQTYEIEVNQNIYNTTIGVGIHNYASNSISNNIKIYSITYEYENIEEYGNY